MSQLPLALGLTAAAAAYLLVCTLPGPLGYDPSQRRLQVSSVSLPAPPSSVTVSGSCIPNLNAIYELQAAAVNGRACYATADGLTMYWSSDGRFGAEWCLDADHDPAGVYAYIISNARSPPDGTTVWQEYCDGAWGSNSLTLTPADVLASAPRSVTVSGSGSCDSAFDFFDATYTLQPVTLNGKPYYATVDETLFIYWSHVDWSGTPFASWSIDSDEDPAEVFAYIASDSDNPPGGTTVWQAYCNDVWGDTPLTLEAQLPAAAAGILALAPQSVTVTGSCAPEADAVYELQAATVNGKPCYVTSDGGLSVHWVPALERTGDTVASWVIESEADTGVGYLMSYVESTADSPPSGMMAWWQLCDDDWVSSTLTVEAPLASSAAALAVLSLAPPTVTINGSCSFLANAIYNMQPTPFNELPHYNTADGRVFLYWAPKSPPRILAPAWYLDFNLDRDDGVFAFFESNVDVPPAGTQEWHAASCIDGVWGSAAVTLDAPPSSTAAATLALAPTTITVTGLRCGGPGGNAVYELQGSFINGRPFYTTSDDQYTLHWQWGFSDGSGTSSGSWCIHRRLGHLGLFRNGSAVASYLSSVSELPPTGSAVWQELCYEERATHKYANRRLQLSPSHPRSTECATAFDLVMPKLSSTCCAPSDGPDCGQNDVVPAECSVDCAHLLTSYTK
jgi:hypothetical protein